MDLIASDDDTHVRRLHRRLHDGLGQCLSLAMMHIDQAAGGPDTGVLARTRELLCEALQQLRAVLDEIAHVGSTHARDLPSRLHACVQDLNALQSVPVTCTVDGLQLSVSQEVCDVLVAATRELLVNACKHGRAVGVDARVFLHAHRLSITVTETHDIRCQPKVCQGATCAGLRLGLASVRHDLSQIGAHLRWRNRGALGVQARISWALQ